MAPWLISRFPPHTHYVELFGGGASVLLVKAPSGLETYNDRDGEAVNFFRVLRDNPDKLIRQIEFSPYAFEEYELSYEPCDDPVERARRFYVRCWQSWGAQSLERSGWRRRKGPGHPPCEVYRQDTLYWTAKRLRLVQFEKDDALAIIERFDGPETLFYADPPYVHGTRASVREGHLRYGHEMTDDDHRALAKRLYAIQGMAIVSGYPSDLYDDLYAGWRTERQAARTIGNSRATEQVWLSPAVAARLSETSKAVVQAALFSAEA